MAVGLVVNGEELLAISISSDPSMRLMVDGSEEQPATETKRSYNGHNVIKLLPIRNNIKMGTFC